MQLLRYGCEGVRRVSAGFAQFTGGLVDSVFEDLHALGNAILREGGKLDECRKVVYGALEPACLWPAVGVFGIPRKNAELQFRFLYFFFEPALASSGQSVGDAHGDGLLDAVPGLSQRLAETLPSILLDRVGRGEFGFDADRESARVKNDDVGLQGRGFAEHVRLLDSDSIVPSRVPFA